MGPSVDTTPTRSPKTDFCVPAPSSPVRSSLPFPPDTHHTPSIPSVVVCKCSPKSPRRNGSTRALLTASRKSWPRKEPPPFSREPAPTLFVLSVLLWCWCCTLRSLLPLPLRNKFPMKKNEEGSRPQHYFIPSQAISLWTWSVAS